VPKRIIGPERRQIDAHVQRGSAEGGAGEEGRDAGIAHRMDIAQRRNPCGQFKHFRGKMNDPQRNFGGSL
jgi:hypothetical protein